MIPELKRSIGGAGVVLAVGLGTAGCGESRADAELVTAKADAILFGELSGPEEDYVVMVEHMTSDMVVYRCSGTLVSPNVVVTARHCVAAFVDKPFTCTPAGELSPASRGGQLGASADPPSSVYIRIGQKPPRVMLPPPPGAAQGAAIFAPNTPSICRNDIAVVVLDRMLEDLPVAPMRLGVGHIRGENIRVVGYGVDDDGFVGTRHTRSWLTIDRVGSSQFEPDGADIPPRTFTTLGPALCIGDSGGPAFSEAGGLSGVWSQFVGDCSNEATTNYFTQLAPFLDTLLVPAFEMAGTLPTLEGASAPGWGDVLVGGAAGASSTGGAPAGGSTGETGGAPTGTGGVGQAGEAATGGNSGGSVGTGGTSSQGGTDASGGNTITEGGTDPTYRGPRKQGGCTCDVVGAQRTASNAAWLAPLLLLGLTFRRRQRPALVPVRIRSSRERRS